MNKELPKYYDAAATTPVDPRVKEVMLPYFDEMFGNASSNHIYGKQAKQAIDKGREHVADLINAEAKEIVFTSGATEAINLAIKGYLEANPNNGNHIITVKTEHKAVLTTCEYLETKGYEVTYLNVDENGLISLEELQNSITDDTALIAVMYVNNEIGIIQPILEIGEIARENNIIFFCDATQAVGKIPVDVIRDHVDMLCLSGHKMNGPKGIGALYMKQGVKVATQIHGGGQENGLRGGTYNTPSIVGLGEACRLGRIEYSQNIGKFQDQKDKLKAFFKENKLGTENFKHKERAPHILSISLNDKDAEDFLMMNEKEFVASTGSACNSSLIETSHVLKALNVQIPQHIIRFSF